MTSKGITLIGMSGVGKSTIGTMVAERLDFAFIDLDAVIKEKEKESHVSILNRVGDRKFLEMEERHALNVPLANAVFSPGGSIVYSARAVEKISDESIVFYLKLPLSQLISRVGHNVGAWDRRGIVGLKEKGLEKLFHEREPLYEEVAHHVIACDNLSDEEVVSRIMSLFTEGS